MNKTAVEHLIRLFGTQRNVARAAGRAESTVSTWKQTGVPINAARRIATNAHQQGVIISCEQILAWIDHDERNRPRDVAGGDSPQARTYPTPKSADPSMAA